MRTSLRIAALAAITASAIAVPGCGAARHAAGPPPRPVVLTSAQVSVLRAYGTGDTAFGLNLLGALCRSQPGANVALSPVSLATGLGMAYLGARGATAAAIARVLHLPATAGGQVAGLGARWALLGSLNRPGVTFTASNRIWADPSLITNPAYAAALRDAVQAGLTHVPLLSAPEAARARINAAIAAQTGGHIKNLLPAGALSGQIGWVLTDALYLNAAWEQPFQHALTVPGPFETRFGRVSAQYLNGDGFAMAQADGWAAAALPYRGGRLSMLALLPPAGGPAGARAAAGCPLPAPATVGALTTGLTSGRSVAAIALPKISLASSESLREVLTALGMGIAFTDAADFTGISPQACCIGFVQHAATLAVGEKGTVASAATAVGVQPGSARVEAMLRFSRPYLLILRASLTGEPLMLAWVANPARS